MKEESEKSHKEELENIKNALKRQEQEVHVNLPRFVENKLSWNNVVYFKWINFGWD